MLNAIQYLHSKNIVHRDLKPENWVFESENENAPIILIDFGRAKIVDDTEKSYDFVGTITYLAPESANGQKFRTGKELKKSDIWAIGIIAYACLVGGPPFHAKTNNELCEAIVNKKLKFKPIHDLSPDFQDFCTKCLIKKPSNRISSEDALEHPWIVQHQKRQISRFTIQALHLQRSIRTLGRNIRTV